MLWDPKSPEVPKHSQHRIEPFSGFNEAMSDGSGLALMIDLARLQYCGPWFTSSSDGCALYRPSNYHVIYTVGTRVRTDFACTLAVAAVCPVAVLVP
jgi:hypothetical protein